ncbi:MAG: ATP-binding protein [Dehalococcoidia bacterium]
MSANTKVLIWGITAVGIAILITWMHFSITQEATLATERRGIAVDISQGALELTILSDQYAIDQSERVLAQWEARFDSISASLEQFNDVDDIGKALISEMKAYLADLKTTFALLADDADNGNQNTFDRARRESNSSGVTIITRLLAADAVSLFDHFGTQVKEALWQSSVLVTMSLLVLIIVLGLFLVTISRQTQMIANANTELAAVNKELESFSYSVSHDLRAPLRSIDGFSQALLEDYTDKLDDQGRNYLQRVRSNTQKMGELIDDLLKLSRVTRSEMKLEMVNLSTLAQSIANELQQTQPGRQVEFVKTPGLNASGDANLLRLLLENLLGNAWKFTAKHPQARIEFGSTRVDGKQVFFVRDDGAGFDMTYADKLFTPFQRLHAAGEFPGIGIGLATVQRIIHRHGGRVWAEGEIEKGAIFYFTLAQI